MHKFSFPIIAQYLALAIRVEQAGTGFMLCGLTLGNIQEIQCLKAKMIGMADLLFQPPRTLQRMLKCTACCLTAH